MHPRVAIIGGTGVGELLLAKPGVPLHILTREGVLRAREVELDGATVLAISRHSPGHRLPPHRVNYAAMALGLKQLGVRLCLATAAVGSLRQEWGAGTLVVCSDFLDLSGRGITLHDNRVVHTDFSEPLSENARKALLQAASRERLQLQEAGVYISVNGPRYETPREIEHLSELGDVVGMTAGSEAIVMREAGLGYALLAIVTNAAAGHGKEPLSHDEVVAEMKRSADKALKLLGGAAKLLSERK